MQSGKRKKVTRVGSGAYSIYLPKKWIDTWLPEQQEVREVELRFISQSLMISPVIQERSYEATVEVDVDTVTMRLLSAYVRGNLQATLFPPEGQAFDNDCVTSARDFLRHLDERLVATSSSRRIGFTLDPELPPPATTGGDLVHVLGAKIREIIDLVGDAVRTYGHDPDRTLHTLHLVQTIQEEDVHRIFHQTLRMVANLEIPMASVSEYQLLALTAAEMHQIGGNAMKIAETILESYGLAPDDLAFPRRHLLERMASPPKMQGVAAEIVRGYRHSFEETQGLLQRLLQALHDRDVPELAEVLRACPPVQDRLQDAAFRAVADHWGAKTGPEEALAAHTASKLGSPLANIIDSLRMVAHHAVALLAARRDGEPA